MKPANQGKICFFNSTHAWGGGEKWHFEMASALNDLGYNILFIAGKDSALSKKLSDSTISYLTLSISNLSFLNPFKIFRLRKLFRKEKVSVIIMNLSADLKVAGIAARLAGVKRIIYRRGSAIPVKNKFLNRWLFSKVLTDVIANSEATKATLLQNNRRLFPLEKIHVIYNGLKIEDFLVANDKKIYDSAPGEILIGHAGRMVYQKAHEYLIDIASNLKKAGVNFTLLLAGSGPLENEVKKKVSDLGLQDDVVFLGFVEDMVLFMKTIDVFVLTSRWEGFGFVLAEAMIQKKPVVAFNISSNPELVVHGKNGFLANPFDTEEFSNYLVTLIRNKQLQENFGNTGFQMVHEKFSFNRSVNNMITLLGEVS